MESHSIFARIEAEQAVKLEAERQAEEARQANQAHRKKICNEALKGLLALGIDEAKGKEILQACFGTNQVLRKLSKNTKIILI
nr:hypothetical protein [Acinetobacter nosocomialis]